MFDTITMIDYSKTLGERAKSRKVCGPYRWSPATPGLGRGFYSDNHNALAMTASGISLRLELANDHLRYSRLSFVNGYYADNFQDCTLVPVIARLPKGRGFLAGWTMGEGMGGALDSCIYDTVEDAAYAAHDMAEYDAEQAREDDSAYYNDYE